MTFLVQPRLTNGPFSDPGLFLDFRFGGRAMLFDLGDLSALSPREILRISHIFVSHMHLDHFSGLDLLLRLSLYRDKQVHIVGPPGLAEAVESKLRAYTWNLLDAQSHDFSITASDWSDQGFVACRRFRARAAFAGETLPRPDMSVPLDDPDFAVEAITLDHGIPCLAFAFQERMRINVHKARLDELGLPVGPWLTEAKRAVRGAKEAAVEFSPIAGRSISLRELVEFGALRCAPGQRIVYATDLAFHDGNVSRLTYLAKGADHLFIEGGFLDRDRDLAAAKKHLTAGQAGEIARRAGVRNAHQIHFSSRYLEREEELRGEFQASLARIDPRPE